MNFEHVLESIKYIILIPIFLFWSLFDVLTKTIMVKWQRSLIIAGIFYNFLYLFIDKSMVNDNITGFVVCYLIAKLYAIIKRLLRLGALGGGDVILFAIIGLFFGTAVGILTIILSFILFDILLKLMMKIFKRIRNISIAFFPFITTALLIIVIFIGETRVRGLYNTFFDILGVKNRFINIF